MSKPNKSNLFSIPILLLAVAGMIIYLNHNREIVALLANLSWFDVALLLLVRLLYFGVNGLFLKVFAQKFDVSLTPKEWYGLACVTAFGNFLTPLSGGMVARATYLKLRHALPYTQFLSLLMANYLVVFWGAALGGMLLALPLLPAAWPILAVFTAVFTAITALALLPVPELSWPLGRLGGYLNQVLVGWRVIRTDGRLLRTLALYTFLSLCLNGVAFWLAFTTLGVPIRWDAALLISLIAIFAIVINLTPGSLGIQEAMVSLSAELLGPGSGAGLLASLLLRATIMLAAFVLGPLYSYLLSRDLATWLSQKPTRSNDD